MNNLAYRLKPQRSLRSGWKFAILSPFQNSLAVPSNFFRSFSDSGRGRPPFPHPRGGRLPTTGRGGGRSGRGSDALSRFIERRGRDWEHRSEADGPSGQASQSQTLAFEAISSEEDIEGMEDEGQPIRRSRLKKSRGSRKTGFTEVDDDDASFMHETFVPEMHYGKYEHDEEDYDELDGEFLEEEIELMEMLGMEKFEELRIRFMEEFLENYKGKEYHDKFMELMYVFYEQDGLDLARDLKMSGGADFEDVKLPANLSNPSDLIEFTDEEVTPENRNKISPNESQDMDDDFFFNSDGIDENFCTADEKDPFAKIVGDGVSPLADHGPDLDEFLTAMETHPTDYAEVKRLKRHPDSMREPRPILPKNRKNPPLEFVTSFVRFIFVAGLPVPEVDGEEFNFDNPLHQHEIKKLVAHTCRVKTEQVSPASRTSAFVGFKTIHEFEQPWVRKTFPATNITMRLCMDLPEKISSSSPGSIIEIFNLPKWVNSECLVQKLFSSGIFGKVTSEDVFKHRGSTLVRFSSNEVASEAIKSDLLRVRLRELGETEVRYFRARRELVREGYGGPLNEEEMRVLGPKLVVDGDAPTRYFFISHADTLQLRNLDKFVTKKEISDLFQPFCSEPRDVDSSIEFVTCHFGERISKAYVGFDRRGEMENVLKAFNGRVKIGNRFAFMKSVKERLSREGPAPRESRPNRSIEELLQDLNDWERHADPQDLEDLVKLGVSKDIVGEAVRNVRFRNPTFASLDQAKSDERLTQNRERGHDYRSFVRQYVKALKNSIATPEDPGIMYLGFFQQSEEVDLSIFDWFKEKQAKIREKRRKWYGE